jgi:hypothetical protein
MKMIRRLFWLGLGLGTGTTIGWLGARWVRRQTQALAPSSLAARAAAGARQFGARLQDAGSEFRKGREEKEAELRPLLNTPA